MSKILEAFNALLVKKMPELRPGDTVRVHQKIKEGNKERIQMFEGIIIARKHGKGISATITVRKVVDGVGVERVFPVYSPAIEKIEVVRSGKVRRSKLYFLRTAKGKRAKLKNREFAAAIADEPVAEVAAPEAAAEVPAEAASEQNAEEGK